MTKAIYTFLLRLHPRAFRERFSDEMSAIFDQAEEGRAALIADAMVSLVRQRLLRSPEPVLVRGRRRRRRRRSGVPRFRERETGPKLAASRNAAVGGDVLDRGALDRPRREIPGFLLIGARHPRPTVLGVERASLLPVVPTTTITVRPEPPDYLDKLAALYFDAIRVLAVVDSNRDRVLSPWEMLFGPTSLRKLDRNGDGALSAEECGFFLGGAADIAPELRRRLRREFMRSNPALAALDADHDGEISGLEIERSATALGTLDRNGDGVVEAFEAMPDPAAQKAAFLLSVADRNHDGRISRVERSIDESAALAELFDSADRDRDGVVTRREIEAELRLRAEMNRQLRNAIEGLAPTRRR